MSDIDIDQDRYVYERSRGPIDPEQLASTLTQFDNLGLAWQYRNVPELMFDFVQAARWLLDLADEGGELWAGAIVTDESRHVMRNAVCWALYGDGTEQVSIGDAQKAEGFRIADHALDQFVDFQRSRVRVWPKETE